MAAFGWLAQPAVLPWVALALGLCIGSFLNVVIHRLPKMMEREWREQCAELTGAAAPAATAHDRPARAIITRRSEKKRFIELARAFGEIAPCMRTKQYNFFHVIF